LTQAGLSTGGETFEMLFIAHPQVKYALWMCQTVIVCKERQVVRTGENKGVLFYRGGTIRTTHVWDMKKRWIIAGKGWGYVEQNALSLFKRWIYAVQRYKKCWIIHNLPNKK